MIVSSRIQVCDLKLDDIFFFLSAYRNTTATEALIPKENQDQTEVEFKVPPPGVSSANKSISIRKSDVTVTADDVTVTSSQETQVSYEMVFFLGEDAKLGNTH